MVMLRDILWDGAWQMGEEPVLLTSPPRTQWLSLRGSAAVYHSELCHLCQTGRAQPAVGNTRTEIKARWRRPRKSPVSACHKRFYSILYWKKNLEKHVGKDVCHTRKQLCSYVTQATCSSLWFFLTLFGLTDRAETQLQGTHWRRLPALLNPDFGINVASSSKVSHRQNMSMPACPCPIWQQNNAGSSSVFTVSNMSPLALKTNELIGR